MKILFISCTFPPDGMGTASVLKKLLPYFKEHNSIDCITLKSNSLDKDCTNDNINIYYAGLRDYPCKIKTPMDFFRRGLTYLKYHIFYKFFRKKTLYNYRIVRAYIKKMKHISMDKYDLIITVCAEYETAEAILTYKKKRNLNGKIALYQLDPLTENEIYKNIKLKRESLCQYEESMYKLFDYVITTPLIYKFKKQLNWDLGNVIYVELPITINQVMSLCKNKDDSIVCVFVGYLYGKLIRDASFTLKLFTELTSMKVRLFFIGTGQEDLINYYERNELKGHLYYLGLKSAEECDEILKNADILINIGNKVNNQLPSKLFNYIGYGKPILNIVSCEDCPSLNYMNIYPLSYNVFESQGITTEVVKNLGLWLNRVKGQTIPTDYIRQLFNPCLPETISHQILKFCGVEYK